MNKILNHLLQTMYEELTSRRIEQFDLTDLSRLSGIAEDTISHQFGNMEILYQQLFEKVILKRVGRACNTIYDFILSFISEAYNNQNLFLNLYYLTMMMNRRNYLINAFKKQFEIYDQRDHYEVIADFIYALTQWFDDNLNSEQPCLTLT